MNYQEFAAKQDIEWENKRIESQRRGDKAYNRGLFWSLFWRFRLDLYPLLRK